MAQATHVRVTLVQIQTDLTRQIIDNMRILERRRLVQTLHVSASDIRSTCQLSKRAQNPQIIDAQCCRKLPLTCTPPETGPNKSDPKRCSVHPRRHSDAGRAFRSPCAPHRAQFPESRTTHNRRRCTPASHRADQSPAPVPCWTERPILHAEPFTELTPIIVV